MYAMIKLNMLSIPKPMARRMPLKVFPTSDETILCLLLMASIIAGLLTALARIL